jgi:hypothetical protein
MKYKSVILLLLTTLLLFTINAEEIVIFSDPVQVLSSGDPEIFPASWLSDRINAQAEILESEDEIKRSKEILQIGIGKYPRKIITENISAVYILYTLKYFGITAGGTNSNRNIYLTNKGASAGYSDIWIEETFHNEFSSILLRNFATLQFQKHWTSINKTTFTYGTNGVDAIKNGESSKAGESSFYNEGFLHQYATSSYENDFNSIAGNLFMGKKDFWSVVDEYTLVSNKVALAIAFYNKLDPLFTYVYFRSLEKTD